MVTSILVSVVFARRGRSKEHLWLVSLAGPQLVGIFLLYPQLFHETRRYFAGPYVLDGNCMEFGPGIANGKCTRLAAMALGTDWHVPKDFLFL